MRRPPAAGVLHTNIPLILNQFLLKSQSSRVSASVLQMSRPPMNSTINGWEKSPLRHSFHELFERDDVSMHKLSGERLFFLRNVVRRTRGGTLLLNGARARIRRTTSKYRQMRSVSFYSSPAAVGCALDAADLRNQLSHLCVARSRRGRQVAHRSRSMQVNATRPDAQRLQSATCRKQPGARRCRRAAGGRCVCSFFFSLSYFRLSFSPPSLSRDHRSRTYVRAPLRNEPCPAGDGFATDTYAQFSGRIAYRRASEDADAASRTRLIPPQVPRENSRIESSGGEKRSTGNRDIGPFEDDDRDLQVVALNILELGIKN